MKRPDIIKAASSIVEVDRMADHGFKMPTETAGELLARLGTDAEKWAAEFNAVAQSRGYQPMDEEWLQGWFANAIESAMTKSGNGYSMFGACECGMTGPCMWDKCKHPLVNEGGAK